VEAGLGRFGSEVWKIGGESDVRAGNIRFSLLRVECAQDVRRSMNSWVAV
jgi:hypothetical protein